MLFRLAGWLRVVNRKDVSRIGCGWMKPKRGSGNLPAPGERGSEEVRRGAGGASGFGGSGRIA